MSGLRLLILLIVSGVAMARAEEPIEEQVGAPVPAPSEECALVALKGVAEPLAVALADLSRLRAELEQAATDEARRGIQMRIDSENERFRLILNLGSVRENERILLHGLPWRVDCSFGIDYRHQADAAAGIPETLQRAIQSALISDHGHEAVRSVKVEFDDAAASSLNYRVLADFDGSLGSRYQALRRQILTICLETCKREGWVIPFTQITLHQAEKE